MHTAKDSKFGLGLLVGVAAGIAGSYVVSKNKERIRAKLWMLQAKYKIRSRAAEIRGLTQDLFSDIVDSVVREYEGVRGITTQELTWFADKVKRRWEDFKTQRVADDTESPLGDERSEESSL